jgi:hypothetical protein
MRGAIPPLPKYAFVAWCLVKHRDSKMFRTTIVLISVEAGIAGDFHQIPLDKTD